MRWFLVALIAASLWAQDSTTDAGVHRSSLLLRSASLPKADEVRVYDFINYHKHLELPLPKGGEKVAFEGRMLRTKLPKGEAKAFLQWGIRTAPPSRIRDAKPVNLCLVIDRSGSMQGENKMEFLKQGLELLVMELTEADILSIVTFDDKVEVLRAAAPVDNPKAIVELIRGLTPRGSTNIHDGLMEGYKQVRRNIKLERMHKVILLSDGQANVGVTDPEKIVEASKAFNDRIALSTVGIGLSYNDRVMSQLAEAGRGTYHFLDSAEGIERTFFQELNSLLECVGKEPVVRVTLAKGVSLERVYGYSFTNPDANVYEFKLLDLPLGLTQIIPMELSVAEGVEEVAKATLTFNGSTMLEASVKVERADGDAPADELVMKNLTIARLAYAFVEACKLAGQQRPQEAADTLDAAMSEARTLYGNWQKVMDKDLHRMLLLVHEALEIVSAKQKK